ncbi:MAG TPA: TadE/TadG family type IV pilus assembly protein [Candidatus Eisenbacteria bacterium]|nr:TadE/TadG family type IV pilus assembly protein [Candidatus Eisenbacteria bacterium]
MTTPWKQTPSDESGQALVELALSALVLLTLVFGAIDFSRAIYYVQVMKNLTAEGSSMSSRGTSLVQTAQTVVTDAGTNLSLSTKGCVITTSVLDTTSAQGGSTYTVTGQATQGNCTGITSQIGCFPPPSTCGTATLPTEAAAALQSSQTLYITEIYYTFSTVTPIGALLKNATVLPSQLYDAAYY